MKKLFLAVLALAMVVSILGGCYNEVSKADKPTQSKETEVQTEATKPAKPTEKETTPKNTEATTNQDPTKPAEQTDISFTNKIAKCKDVYYTTTDELSTYNYEVFGTSATAYYKNGDLRMLKELPEYNPMIDDFSEGEKKKYFYFENGQLYFIFLVDANTSAEDRLYFYNGQLIRWIDSNSTVHDNSAEFDKMEEWHDYAMGKYNSVVNR